MKYLSVCSGMEAASVAWHPLGWTPVGFSEIEPFPCAILKHRFPNVPNYGSLTAFQSWPIEQGAVDLLVGGTPCQSFSVAGKRGGLNDPRGQLMFSFLGLAEKLGKPRWIVWENVPGCLSSGEPKGSDFGCLIQGLVELGYGVSWRILDAQYFGVPQRRRRVFVVACLGDWRAAAEVLSITEGVRGYLETGNKKRKGVAADAGASVEAGCLPIWRAGDQANAEHMIDHAGTVSCNKGSHGGFIAKPVIYDMKQHHNPQLANSVQLTTKNCSMVRGDNPLVQSPIPFRKSKRACSTTDNETWVPADASNTLNNFDLGDTRTTHAVVQPVGFSMREDATNGTFDVKQVDTSLCLQALRPAVTSHHAQNIVVQPIPIQDGREMEKKQNGLGIANQGDPAYTIDTTGAQAAAVPFRKSKRAQSTTDHETWVEAEASNTLTPHIVQASELRLRGQITEKDVCPTLTAGAKQGDTEPLAVHAISFQPGNLVRKAGADPSTEVFPTLSKDSGDQNPHVATVQPAMAVRRLTPRECERLQGFPDNWSRISWKGKPEEDCPDGPRYKACGNSMAVPVMNWIGNRIAEVEAKG